MANCIQFTLLIFGITNVWAANTTIEFCTEGENLDKETRICTVQDQDLVVNKGFIWSRSNINEVHFINSQITCRTEMQTGCSITLELTKTDVRTQISFEQGSGVHAQGIYIIAPNGQLSIDETSTLEANGRSLHSRGSSTAGADGQGASYIGQGGSCAAVQQDLTYGSFDMMPNPDNIYDSVLVTHVGSAGIGRPTVDRATAGGGHVYINVDSISFSCSGNGNFSQIAADGFPSRGTPETTGRDLHGGTGGYIYIKTGTQYRRNSIIGHCEVSAQGGFGKGIGYGGAGGVVVLDGRTYSVGMVHINGGKSGSHFDKPIYKGCGNAASGTFYTVGYEALIVDNSLESDKATILWATKESSKYPGKHMVAHDFWVGPKTNIVIKKDNIPEILFPTLYMAPYSNMTFDMPWAAQLTIKYRDSFDVHATSILDFTKIQQLTMFQSIASLGYANAVRLGMVKFSGHLYIEVNELNLRNETLDPNPPADVRQSSILLMTNELTIGRGAKIQSGKIFMFANDSITIHEDAGIQSSVQNECHIHDSHYDLFQCTTPEKDQDELNLQYVLDMYNQQYGQEKSDGHYARRSRDMAKYITGKWNVYILSLGKLGLKGAWIKGPRIGICANSIEVELSQIDASGRGCMHDAGLGKGSIGDECGGSGGSHGGQGGYGATQTTNQGRSYAAKCESFAPKPYYLNHEARYEGSGGGSADTKGESGGAGGGVVWLTTPQTMLLKGNWIHANGAEGEITEREQAGSGGGAGGSVKVMALNLEGSETSIEAKGADGTDRGGGGGAGGRLIINLLRSYRADSQPSQTGFWNGTYNISGGSAGHMAAKYKQASAGEDGNIYSTKCMPGYSGPFCKACSAGTFKPDYSYGVCETCRNKPVNGEYNMEGETTALCSYQCKESGIIERVETNPDCLDPVSLEMQRLGGVTSFFGLLSIFLLFAYLIYFSMQCKTMEILKERKGLKDKIYAAWEDSAPQMHRGRVAEHFYPLNDQTIWCHTHRMYLVGQNSPNFPWIIPKNFPRDALAKEHREQLIKFIDEANEELRYSVSEQWLIRLINLLYPPMAQYLTHEFFRKRKFRMLQRALFRHFSPQFWSDRGDNKSLRLGWSKADHNLAYIDFIDFERNRENWLGVKLNMPILLAGSGTYHHPYFLDYRDDVYAKSLVLVKYSFFYDKLSVFFENFNSQLNKISFYKLDVQVMRDLTKSVFWLETANRTMFNHFNMKGVLYIIENSYNETDPGVFKQKRRSFPLETCFFDAFPEMFLTMINYVRQKLISGKSEIRMAIVFKRYVKTKEIKSKLRIGKMIKESSSEKKAYAQAIEKQESVLFDVEDNQKEDDKLTYANRQKTSNQYLPNASSSESIENPSTNIQDEVETKMVDTSLQAFSISIDSSKMFEIAIRKPRNKTKHMITRFRASLYSVYLMLIKNHGSQPKDKDFNNWLLLYSFLLAIDFMILFHYTLHIFVPFDNFAKFGWIFFFIYWMVPYYSPILAFLGAIYANEGFLKIMGHMNSICITVNIPLVFLLSIYNDEDPSYHLVLMLMIAVKILVNIVSSRVRQYIINPRYESNKTKLTKILQRQKTKLRKREEILGKDVSHQAFNGVPIDFGRVEVLNTNEAKKYLTQLHEEEQPLQDKDKLRDKLLED